MKTALFTAILMAILLWGVSVAYFVGHRNGYTEGHSACTHITHESTFWELGSPDGKHITGKVGGERKR